MTKSASALLAVLSSLSRKHAANMNPQCSFFWGGGVAQKQVFVYCTLHVSTSNYRDKLHCQMTFLNKCSYLPVNTKSEQSIGSP